MCEELMNWENERFWHRMLVIKSSRGRSRRRLCALIKVTKKNDVATRFQFERQQIAAGSDQWNMSRYEQEHKAPIYY